MFQDDVNPTADEIRAWATEPNAMFPMEDWDIVLASLAEHDRLYIDLAGSKLPGADTFLRCLYIIIGDAIRTQWRARTRSQVEELIGIGAKSPDPSVKKWAGAARQVLDHPEMFNADDWIFGGSAKEHDAV